MLVIGHRGSPLQEPENTIRSFEKAVRIGADMLEMDVHRCASGELVVIHDDKVDRTTDGSGEVSKLDLSEIRELDAGSGEAVPTLDEVLKQFSGKVGFNIELKGRGTAESVWKLLKGRIESGSILQNDILISSFRPDEIFDIRTRSGEIKLGCVFENYPNMGFDFAGDIDAWSIHPISDLVDERIMERARQMDLKVIVWTVNDEIGMKRMIELGVEGIITDRPELLAGMVKS